MREEKHACAQLAQEVLELCRIGLAARYPMLYGAFGVLGEAQWPHACIGTDGLNVFYDPQALVRLFAADPARLRHTYLHLLLHGLYRHILPPEGVDRALWDLACDMVTERILLPEQQDALAGTDERRRCLALLGPQALAPEAVMHRISLLPYPRAELERLFAFDDHRLWGTQAEQAVEERWENARSCAQSFRKSERSQLEDGAEADTAVTLLPPRKKSERSYRNYLRKFAVPGEEIEPDLESFDYIYYGLGLQVYGNLPLIEPLEYREVWRIRELVIAIDTSESCEGETVKRFLEETYAILSSSESFFHKMNVHIIQCDAAVQMDKRITSKEELAQFMEDFELRGSGGTDFRPVFQYVDKLIAERAFQNLKGLIYFTDGYGIFPKRRPPYDAAFVFYHEDYTDVGVPPWAMKLILGKEDLSLGLPSHGR